MIFSKVGIALTDRCSASCAMCCFRCTPHNRQVLSRETVFSVIRQAGEIPEIKAVGLSGGEAMLYPELVLDSIAEIKRLHMRATLTSNGFWAKDDAAAADMLAALRRAGLDGLSVSVDAYHMQYVPLDCIRRLLRLCPQQGIPLSLALGDVLSGPRAGELVATLGRDLYQTQVTVYPFMPVGAGSDLDTEAFSTVPFEETWQCPFQGDLLVLYDGAAYPCCSQAVYQNALSNGSIYTHSLRELMESYERVCLFSGLRRMGFGKMATIAADVGIALSEAFVSPCHLCSTLFGNPAFCAAVQPYIEAEYAGLVKTALTGGKGESA
ncbi:MAG: radical SAM protein [Eubacteriales bacterium]|nr:radical SAM protein [Eubacteriales bacterium]